MVKFIVIISVAWLPIHFSIRRFARNGVLNPPASQNSGVAPGGFLGNAEASEAPPQLAVEVLRSADEHALAVGACNGVSVPELARILSKRKDGSTVSDTGWIARCVFRWIAENIAYDAQALRTKRFRDPDPDEVLRSRKSVCEGYSALFTSLCQELGIEAATIHGFAHVDAEDIGRTIGPGEAGHAWNAVKLAGKWALLDVTWAAGSVESHQFNKRFDPDWFIVPAEQMIFSHWPEESRWQLLKGNVPRAAFEQFAVVKPHFFANVANTQIAVTGIIPPTTPALTIEAKAGAKFLAHFVPEGGKPVDMRLDETGTGAARKLELFLPELRDSAGRIEFFMQPRGRTDGHYALGADFRVRGGQAISQPRKSDEPVPKGGPPPKFFAGFQQRGAKLDRPLAHDLPAGSQQRFRISVPGARNVRILDKTVPYFLHHTDGDWFEGTLPVPKGLFVLYAVFSERAEGNHEMEGLIEFEGK